MEQIEDVEEKTIELVRKIQERVLIVNSLTTSILQELEPTVLTAFLELIQQPDNNVAWVEVGNTNVNLMLVCIVTYVPNNMNVFLRHLLKETSKDTTERTQFLHIGVPLTHVFSHKNIIKRFLIEASGIPTIGSNVPETTTPVKSDAAFDLSLLTDEQKKQIMPTIKGGVKH